METDGDGGGGGGEAERRGSSELGRLLDFIGSSEVLEKRIPLIKQLEEEFSANDLGLILQALLASWIDSTCSGVSHCSLHKSILQVALKCSDLDITDHLGQFLTLGAKASSWCEKHLQWSAKCIHQSQVGEEEEHNRLCQEVNSLSLSISTKLLYIAAKRITIPGLEVAEGEEGQEAAQDDECVLNMADDVFPTLDTLAVEVEPAPAHLAVAMRRGAMAPQWCRCTHCASENTPRWYRGPDGPGTLCSMCWHRFKKGRLQHSNPGRRCRDPLSKHPPCLNCASEKTPRWLRGPDGPSTLCSACGQRFLIGRLSNPRHRRGQQLLKGRLLDSISHRHRGRPSKERRSSSKGDLAAGNDMAALPEALPISLDGFFDHTCSEVPWGDANEEEELEWLLNKDAFPSVEMEEEASAPDVPRARTKGRRRVTAMETTCPQANVPPDGDLRAEKETVRRCTHCGTENTPEWREGPEGPCTLCNACGTVFKMKGRLLPEYRPANSPAFSPLLQSNRYSRVLGMQRRNETSATGEMHVVLMDPPANGPISSPTAEKGTVRRCTRCETEKTSRWREGPEGPHTLCNACGVVFKKKERLLAKETVRRCTRCATENTPQWREGPEGPRTLCNACGVVFKKKGRLLPEYRPANSPTFSPLLHSNRYKRVLEMHRRNETSATGEMQVAAAEAPRGEAPLVSRARTKGRRRVTARETTCRQANVPTTATPAAVPQRRRRQCTHCATENTPEWRQGPEGPHSLCNACGMVFRKKGRLLAEYRPANSPAFSPLLHSNTYARALKMHLQNEATAACHDEVHSVLMEGQLLPPPNGPTSASPPLLRLDLDEEAFPVIRATVEARRTERAAAFLAALDN